MKVYAYRDDLDGMTKGSYFGVNLYFIRDEAELEEPEETTIPKITADDVKPMIKGRADIPGIVKAVNNWLRKNNPIIRFIIDCIEEDVGENSCLKLAKDSKIKHRRQNAQVLYKWIRQQPEPETGEDEPPYELYEEIQDYIAEQLEDNFGMNYVKNEALSEATLDEGESLELEYTAPVDAVRHGDFIIEIGEKHSYKFRYWAHWHKTGARWKPWHMFNDFDELRMRGMLKRLD
jgi:hypothetical protein